MKYAVNPEGVAELMRLCRNMKENEERMREVADRLDYVAGYEGGGLGVHSVSIQDVAESIRRIMNMTGDSVETLCLNIFSLAEAYQDIIDNNAYDSLDDTDGEHDPPVKKKVLRR